MIASLVFAGLLLLATAPFAGILAAKRRFGPESLYAGLAMWFALIGLCALIAGIPARNPWLVTLLEAIEVGGMVAAGAAIVTASRARASARPRAIFMIALLAASGSTVALSAWHDASVAAALSWTFMTCVALTLFATRESPDDERSKFTRPGLLVASSFLIVHTAQAAQIVAQGELRAAVPLASLLTLALAVAWGVSRILAPKPARYDHSGLSHADAEAIFARIEAAMDRHKPYRSPDFSRDDLAHKLDLEPRLVGEAINRVSGAGFAAYLRNWRVREAERLLLRPENARVSLDALGLEAGFGSRSAFYAAFEEAFSMSPGAYRRNAVRGQRDGQQIAGA